jgi:hypothetical protein
MSDIYWTEEEDDGQEPEPEEDTSFEEVNAKIVSSTIYHSTSLVDDILTPGRSPEEALTKVRDYQEDWVTYGVDRVHKHYDLVDDILAPGESPEDYGPELSHSPRGMFRILKKFIRVLLG